MRISLSNRLRLNSTGGMSLVEMLVAVGLGSLVLGSAGVVFIYSLFSFAGLGNYAILTGQSKLSLDYISRDIRETTRVMGWTTNASAKTLTLTNAIERTATVISWDSGTGVLTMEKTGEPTRTFLTGCDQWDVTFFQRSPRANWAFVNTSDLSLCKLINMNWKCSRSILGKKINTETVVTAQVVLRNRL